MQFIVLALCLAAAAAVPVSPIVEARRRLPALDHEEVHDQYGQYALRYVTAEGTVVSERGRLVPNKDHTGYVMVVEGEVSYIGDDGQTYVTKYSAGLDGTHVEASHLPVPVAVDPVPVGPVAVEPVAVYPVAVETVAPHRVAVNSVAPQHVAVNPVAPQHVAVNLVAPQHVASQRVSVKPVASHLTAPHPAVVHPTSVHPVNEVKRNVYAPQ